MTELTSSATGFKYYDFSSPETRKIIASFNVVETKAAAGASKRPPLRALIGSYITRANT